MPSVHHTFYWEVSYWEPTFMLHTCHSTEKGLEVSLVRKKMAVMFFAQMKVVIILMLQLRRHSAFCLEHSISGRYPSTNLRFTDHLLSAGSGPWGCTFAKKTGMVTALVELKRWEIKKKSTYIF